MFVRPILAALVLAAVATPAQAAITVFTDRTAFNAAAGALTLETFESFSSEIAFRTAPLTVGGLTFQGFGTGQQGRNIVDIPPPQFSEFSIGGTNQLSLINNATSRVQVSFASAITAFGGDFGGYQDDILRSRITVLGSDVVAPVTAGSTARFFGFISDTPFTSLVFQSHQQAATNGDGFGLDNIAYGGSATRGVPEPATWALMLLGFGAIGAAMRRRQPVRVTYA